MTRLVPGRVAAGRPAAGRAAGARGALAGTCSALAVGLVGCASSAPPDPAGNAALDFLVRLAEPRLALAYDDLCPRLRRDYGSPDVMAQHLAAGGLGYVWRYSRSTSTPPSVRGDTASVVMGVKTQQGLSEYRPVTFEMQRVAGRWTVCGGPGLS